MSKSGTVDTAKNIQALGLKCIEDGAYIALGRGDISWDTTVTDTATFVADAFTITPTNAFADGVRLFEAGNPLVEYTKNVDFTFNVDNGVVNRIPTGAIPVGATVDIEYVAIGLVPNTQTALIDELGRKQARLRYVERDDINGTIFIEGGKYLVSATPTAFVLADATFEVFELAGEFLRETGFFFDAIPQTVAQTATETFSNDKIIVDVEVNTSTKVLSNLVVKSSGGATTYVEGTDYIVNNETAEVYRLQSGSISVGEIVDLEYDKVDQDLFLPGEMTDNGLMYAAETFKAKDRDAFGQMTQQFLIRLTL